MTRALTILALLVGPPLFTDTSTQPAPAFEVASIKPVDGRGSYRYTFPRGGGFSARLPLEWLIGIAYDVRPFERIVGEPGWVRTQFFDIEAKAGGPASQPETLAMLRALLEDRFGLSWRKDPSGKATVYALTMAREDKRLGPGIRPSGTACLKVAGAPLSDRRLRPSVPVPCGSGAADGVHAAGSVPMRMVASTLQLALGEEVVDRTGLAGTYDFYIVLPGSGQDPAAQRVGDGSVFTAIEEQFGMKLQREEVTRDAFVVERVSPPSPN
jgi:uncharacterized protein (TIGR03435 family)